MYLLNVHSICMSIVFFDNAIKYLWKTWKKSGKIMEFQNGNLVATLIVAFRPLECIKRYWESIYAESK